MSRDSGPSRVGYRMGYRGVSQSLYPGCMSLRELAIRAARPRAKPYEVYDEKGLFLLVRPSGARLWRFKYSLALQAAH
jgi:Arm DNA-binding domain